MGTEAIGPQSIRNVTIIGDPGDTTRITHRLFRPFTETTSGPVALIPWTTDHIEHTIRISTVSSRAPMATLERCIRVADGVLAVLNASAQSSVRPETVLRVADDHQVARLCLVTGLYQRGADFTRCVRTIADAHGAVPLTLQIPHGTGLECEGVVDLVPMWTLAPTAAEYYGNHWQIAEAWYRHLVDTVREQHTSEPVDIAAAREITPARLHRRIGHLTRMGEAAPVLCDAGRQIAPLLDAIARYLPSPRQVCQPEHALDY